MNTETLLTNLDDPIQSFSEDLLQRQGFVQCLCKIVAAPPLNESTVFALYGEWGSGKSSIKNLLKKELTSLDDKTVLPIEFNPWAFSGQNQVMEAFFTEIGKAISREANGKEAAEGFKKLGAYLSFGAKTAKTAQIGMDLFGIPGSKLIGLVGEHLEGGSKDAKGYGEDISAISEASLEQVHKELKTVLIKFERRLLIVLDDLDRLTPDQLLTVFQLVKVNANLPRVNYLLLMDRKTVEERLKEKHLGPEFVEKIVQFELNLPHVGSQDLKKLLRDGFKEIMSSFDDRIDWVRWEEAWIHGGQNLFTTLRRIKRFLHTLKFHVQLFANDDVLEVDPVDLFLAEILRRFAPSAYEQLPRILNRIVTPRSDIFSFFEKDDAANFGDKELKKILKVAPPDINSEIEGLLQIMFPQLRRGPDLKKEMELIRDCRICHEFFFESYFRLAIPNQQLTQKEVKEVFDAMENKQSLKAKLSDLCTKVGLRELLLRVQCHNKRLKPELVQNFLCEIWGLDEKDALEAGIERKWQTRDATQAMSRFLLKNYCQKNHLKAVALQAMNDSGTIYPLARFVKSEREELEADPHSSNTAFDAQALEELRKLVLEQIHGTAIKGKLLDSPDAGVLLIMWARLESVQVVRDWLKSQVQYSERLPFILTRFIFKNTITDHRGERAHYAVSRKIIEQFFDLDQLEQHLKPIDTTKLAHWEKFAVQETMKRADEKRRGIHEADYGE